jgi:hypothetical protein
MTGSERQIQERTEIFVEELIELLQRAALELAGAAIEDATGAPARTSKGRSGSSRELDQPEFEAERPKGKKRSPEELEQLTADLGAYIKDNAGQRAEQIAEAMGVATRDLQLPVKKLIEAGAISTKGQKRSTQYFPQ